MLPATAGRFACRLPQLSVRRHRLFHASRPAWVAVGSALPDVDLVEHSPGNKVNLFNEIKGSALIIGVPAAFSTLSLYSYALSPSLSLFDLLPFCVLLPSCGWREFMSLAQSSILPQEVRSTASATSYDWIWI